MRPRADSSARQRTGSLVGALGDLSPAARLLAVNQAGINLGFFMVLPYLAAYLTDGLGMAAAAVGMVLGARTLSQQGLFLPSGALVDRVGPWPSIVAGCGLRVVAFGMLGVLKDPVSVVVSVLLIGVAGALFTPAVRKYLALESPERRAENFAAFEVLGNVGALLGPVLGAGALLIADFQTVCLVAAAVFGTLTVAQFAVLPRAHRVASPEPVLVGVRRVLTDRLLGTQVLACSAYFALFNQLYLALPIEAKRVTGRPESIAGVFLVSCALGIALQVRVTALCRRRWTAAQATVAGLAVMAMSFLPLLATTGLLPDQHRALPLSQVMPHAWPLLLTTVLFSLGVAMVTPFIVVLLADAVGDALLGTAYGWYFLVSALAATAVATAYGALLDLGGTSGRTWSFALLVAVGIAGALGLRAVDRRRQCKDGDPPQP
jgi:MFS family permease